MADLCISVLSSLNTVDISSFMGMGTPLIVPGFQEILRTVEANYQAEHERVRQWLEENDML